MNIKKYLILALIAVLGAINTRAATGPDTSRLSKDDAVYTFIGALMGGQTIHSLENALDDSFQYSFLRLGHQSSLDKRYTINFFKKGTITVPDYKIKVLPVSHSETQAVVKVDMQYRSFLHSDYLTLTNTGSGGWKIIFVYDVYEYPERKAE